MTDPVGFVDVDGHRRIVLRCEDDEMHQVTVHGSHVDLVDLHDPDVVAATVAFGGHPPVCHRVVAAARKRWGSRQKNRFTNTEGWARKTVIVAAFVVSGFDLRLPDDVDVVAGSGWEPYAQDLFWSSLTDHEIVGWVTAGFVERDDVLAWSTVGVPSMCRRWRHGGYRSDEAATAVRAGLCSPEEADEARRRLRALGDPRIDVRQEIGWVAAGARTVEDVSGWFQVGVTRGNEAAVWVAHGFSPAEAAQWMQNGFESGHEAARWHEAGWSPHEAGQAVRDGATGVRHANTLRSRNVLGSSLSQPGRTTTT